MTQSGSVILAWLDGASDAAREARRDSDAAEALHRFRVDVRRLNVCLKAARHRDGVPGKLRRRLRRALRATGPLRDGHIRTLWLSEHARDSGSRDRGASALARALRRHGDAAAPRPRRWRKVERTLARIRRALEDSPRRREAARAARTTAAEKSWRRLARKLLRLETNRDSAALHAARIAVKTLRYLLESLRSVPDGLPSPSALRGLQSALGEAHDRDVIAADVEGALSDAVLRPAARRALRKLKREKGSRLSCARKYWQPLLKRWDGRVHS
ncbi:MAG: CHAD domain-containing protein [Elusimicrobiota bacterium]